MVETFHSCLNGSDQGRDLTVGVGHLAYDELFEVVGSLTDPVTHRVERVSTHTVHPIWPFEGRRES